MASEQIKTLLKNKIETFISNLSEDYKHSLEGDKIFFSLVIGEPIDSVKIRLTLEDLEAICNESLMTFNKNIAIQGGIRNRTRERNVCIHRQVFFYFATSRKEMGYGKTQTGLYLNYDHSSVIYGARIVSGLLEVNDSLVKDIYESILFKVKEHKRNLIKNKQNDN